MDLLWTVDVFMHRDVKSGRLRTFNPVYVTLGTDTTWETGRDGKGQAMRLAPTQRGWAVIGKGLLSHKVELLYYHIPGI